MSNNRPTVLILASDPGFSREIKAHWPKDGSRSSESPEFIVLDEGFSRSLEGSHYDLAIADASCVERTNEGKNERSAERNVDKPKRKRQNQLQNHSLNLDLKLSLLAAGKPGIIIYSDLVRDHPGLDFFKLDGSILELRRERGLWPGIAGLLGREILLRTQADSRAREAEKVSAVAEAEALLGRYMVEMRTNINNALTTVLGNAELLVLEPGLPSAVLAQADTLRNMALRLHEIFQRFSSLEKELTVAARESGKKAAHAAAGR